MDSDEFARATSDYQRPKGADETFGDFLDRMHLALPPEDYPITANLVAFIKASHDVDGAIDPGDMMVELLGAVFSLETRVAALEHRQK
ncbi:hypothetical protein ABCS02_30885 [Microbacterium sp. X-17]|uniref:hypothetical protein n=1 Tax=Microbacterium sp. X-17 TaxID=3144404 RepID=UPI0031F59776